MNIVWHRRLLPMIVVCFCKCPRLPTSAQGRKVPSSGPAQSWIVWQEPAYPKAGNCQTIRRQSTNKLFDSTELLQHTSCLHMSLTQQNTIQIRLD
jgi:hypothetical protein